ncbi:tellurite resistance protein TerA [Actinacidiphila alni]|uniref:Tellurite resistance protein TerA n=1 Tax=Actinacidiphila alni TaxID=380248 RepID=A0A1I2JRX7_9ACTN|nr:TerD family protein [Actinacidiphila alni]SFF56680.1 tellurite resistance protein TerA [Actinacidiphila alni]
MTLRKGENVPLPTAVLRVEFSRRAGADIPRADVCALLVADGAARGPDDLVHAAAPAHPSGAVRYEGGDATAAQGTATDTLSVDLTSVEPAVTVVLIVARAEGGTFGRIPGLRLRVGNGGVEAALFDCEGATAETAYVLGEYYRRGGGWKFRAVGQGYDTGLAGLGAAYGLRPDQLPDRIPESAPGNRTLAAPAPASVAPSAPAPAPAPVVPPAPAPVRLSKVTLTKDAPAVSLTKQGGTTGALRVNLSWQVDTSRTGSSYRKGGGVDLDLCALFELSDGSKGVVQALGDAFGSFHQPPFILLDGDDRTGATATGENLTVNLDHTAHFRRILIFVTIYEGARSFAGLHATVTLQPQHGAPVDFVLDECTVQSNVCALALVTRDGSDLVVRREARYLVPRRGVSPQRTVDYAYGWGLNWTPGRK